MLGHRTEVDDFVFVEDTEKESDPELIAKLTRWLELTDYSAASSEFRRHLSSQASETGLWLVETDKYKQWHDSDSVGSIWLKGNAGVGKPVVAASLT